MLWSIGIYQRLTNSKTWWLLGIHAIVWPYNCWMNDAIYLPMGNMNLPSLVEISKVDFKNKLRCYKFTDRHMVNKPNMIKWVTFLQGTEWNNFKCLKNIIWMNIFIWQGLHDPWHFQNYDDRDHLLIIMANIYQFRSRWNEMTSLQAWVH